MYTKYLVSVGVLIRTGLKYVGAADVALAASTIVTFPKGSLGVSYDRNNVAPSGRFAFSLSIDTTKLWTLIDLFMNTWEDQVCSQRWDQTHIGQVFSSDGQRNNSEL